MTNAFGYAGKMLRVDLSSGRTTSVLTADYADNFIGGRGIAARMYWDEVSPDLEPYDPENCLYFMTGPLAGIRGLAGQRWEIAGKSYGIGPKQFLHCNMGGRWGARLKLAGYDGLTIKGRAEKPSYLLIQDDVIEIRDASALWGMGAIETREHLRKELDSSVSVVACGPAGENMVPIAALIADQDASGAGGFAAVMGSKKLKAIVVRGEGKVKVADPEELKRLIRHISELKSSFSLPHVGLEPADSSRMKKQRCFGCPGKCFRMTYEASDGKKGKFMCLSGVFYQEIARLQDPNKNEVPFYVNKLCDEYGLDIASVMPIVVWLLMCFYAGALNEEDTGLPLSKVGSLEFMEELVKKISRREGIGDLLAHGVLHAANEMGGPAKEQVPEFAMKTLYMPHDPRMYITTGLLYATESRPTPSLYAEIMELLMEWFLKANGMIEETFMSNETMARIAKRFFGTELAVDFSTYEGKALAAKSIQDRESAMESMILCNLAFPITYVRHTEDHMGDPTLESKLYSAVTGKGMEEEEYYHAGERIFNLERAILSREVHKGREEDALPDQCFEVPLGESLSPFNPGALVPGNNGEVITRKGTVLDRDRFEDLKSEYYSLRGWDVRTGLQTRGKLNELGLSNVADELEKRNRLGID